MFNFKKVPLEELLGQLEVARNNYNMELAELEYLETRYDDSLEAFNRDKHAYEKALMDYTRFGGEAYASKEASAREIYSTSLKRYTADNFYMSKQACRFKKATKTYQKLQKKVDRRKQQEENQPQ